MDVASLRDSSARSMSRAMDALGGRCKGATRAGVGSTSTWLEREEWAWWDGSR